MRKPTKLILLRHGQSLWNKLNFFTGWVDIPLSWEGIQESIEAGKKIASIPIDHIFVSSLIRAQMTAMIVMAVHRGEKVPMVLHPGEGKLEEWAQIYNDHAEKRVIPVTQAWQLNERMYGKLQGLNKQETREKYGAEQVQIWRRSYDVAPPEGESLEDTAKRSIPYFKKHIVPHLQAGKNVFVSAHGNSLRSIMMHLDNLTKEQVVKLELATGDPVIYHYTDGKWDKQQPHAHG
ncbi:MAG TPA: 2,3-bisphosphoglycerate-dependent phosphoglycerate mutase [Rhabdochlamydiaceae bacterium]|nr:2,3-bisphosphoglycerate-dependent phosphoglycerate mutase [Rhabdochlamydiaceae bacterium]